MVEKTITITNPTGLHARPSSLFVNFIKKYECNITLKSKEKTANAKSVLNLLALGLSQGAEVTVCVEGVNENNVLNEIVDFINNLKD